MGSLGGMGCILGGGRKDVLLRFNISAAGLWHSRGPWFGGFFEEAGVAAADDFGDGGKVVLAFDGFDSESAIVGPVWPAIAESDE